MEKILIMQEELDWFNQWNRLGLECLENETFEETESMRLRIELKNMKNGQEKLRNELKETLHSLVLLQGEFVKQLKEHEHNRFQKKELIVERDNILLRLQEVEAKNTLLLSEVNEQSKTMIKIGEDFNLKLFQHEIIQQNLKSNLIGQEATYLEKIRQLEETVNVYMNQKDELIEERDGILHQLQETEVKYGMLSDQMDEYSKSMQKIIEEYNINLSQNEATRQKLLTDLRNQDISYTNQTQELQVKTNECLRLYQVLHRDRENMVCPICFCLWEEEGDHRLVSLPCGHLYGDLCIRNHLARNAECPMCRKATEISQLIYLYGPNIVPIDED